MIYITDLDGTNACLFFCVFFRQKDRQPHTHTDSIELNYNIRSTRPYLSLSFLYVSTSALHAERKDRRQCVQQISTSKPGVCQE